jgi:hypothetical protein
MIRHKNKPYLMISLIKVLEGHHHMTIKNFKYEYKKTVLLLFL